MFPYQLIIIFMGRIFAGFAHGIGNSNSSLERVGMLIGIILTFAARFLPPEFNATWIATLIGISCISTSFLISLIMWKLNHQEKKKLVDKSKRISTVFSVFKTIYIRLAFAIEFVLPLCVISIAIIEKSHSNNLNQKFFDEHDFQIMISLIYMTRVFIVLLVSSAFIWNESLRSQIVSCLRMIFLLVLVYFITSAGSLQNEIIVFIELLYQIMNVKVSTKTLMLEDQEKSIVAYFSFLIQNLLQIIIIAILSGISAWFKPVFVGVIFTVITVISEMGCVILLYKHMKMVEEEKQLISQN
jgi:hypothetical protein